VRPTGFGEACVARARAILQAVDDLDDLARAARGGLAGRLRLGVIPTVAPYLLPAVLSALAGAGRAIDVRLRECLTPRLLGDLADGLLDAAILALPVSEPGMAEVALFSEAFVLVRPAAEAGLPVPGPAALGGMRLLVLEEGHCFRDQALAFCALRAVPRDRLDASSLATLVQMVAAGHGVTLVPEMAVAVGTRTAAVAVARFGAPEPARTIGMVWRRATPLARDLARIAAIVGAAAASLRAASAPAGAAPAPPPPADAPFRPPRTRRLTRAARSHDPRPTSGRDRGRAPDSLSVMARP